MVSEIVNQFSNLPGIIASVARAARNLVPPADILPSDWAEINISIPLGNSAPGPIRFDNSPPQRGMIDVIKETGIRRVSYMLAAQTGKTTVMQAIVGYHIDHDPKSMIFCQPSEGDMRVFLEAKLKPMLETCKSIRQKVAKSRGKNGVNNSRMISYPAGWLLMAWAGSAKTLRGRSAPIALADEVDGFETTAEGNPLQLLHQRTASFGDQAILIESSTPTIKGASNIETGFLLGDQRRWYVPCPDCGEHQVMKWPQVVWDGRDDPEGEQDPTSARYACEHCGSLWDDGMRVAAIRAGEWRASKPFKGHASFHLPELCSTFRRLRDVVQSYVDKMAAGDAQSFVNVSLAETFEESAEKADPNALMERREQYRAPVPMRGLYLTAGVDMQVDRLEVEIVAWGMFEESHSVDFRVLYGDPLGGDVWNDLDDLLAEEFAHESGAALSIQATCIDTGGTTGYTQAAYEYIRQRRARKIFAIKGVGGWGRQIVEKPMRKQSGKHSRKVDLYLVGVDEAKLIVMRRLALQKLGPGYCHFPLDDAHDEDYFKQLTAEKLVTRYVKGFPVREWHKPDKARNEALDCRVYAMAALKIMNPSLKQLAKRLILDEKTGVFEPEKRESGYQKREIEPPKPVLQDAAINPHIEPEREKPETKPIKRAKSLSAGRRRGGFATNW